MQVTLLDYTGKGQGSMAAADLMIFTKNTRLTQSPDAFNEIKNWDYETKMHELEYMTRSIPSSWEFVDCTFLIQNVSRAFCQQFTRTRTGSYAMSSQRVVDQSDFTYTSGSTVNEDFHQVMGYLSDEYKNLIRNGVSVEDARGILPMNVHSNIVAKFNLRTLCDMAKSRTGIRTQSEYRDVFDEMVKCVIEAWPWAERFLFPAGKEVSKPLEGLIDDSYEAGAITNEERMDLHKIIDLMKKGVK
jgi:flavin-dependent thymidylate synthase